MSYNGSGTFNINSAGQPVVTGTVISSTAFNALTADLGTGLSTAITKDGQTVATARIPFAAGINSSLVTDATNTTTGSIITAGGVGIAKALFVGTTANIAGTTTLAGVTATSITDSGLTSGRVTYAGTAGLLQDSANLLYSGTDLTVYGVTVGRGAGAVATNTAVGASALVANTTADENVAIGALAMTSTTTGNANTAVGRSALRDTTTGAENTAVGRTTLVANTTGSNNSGTGRGALQGNTTGSYNTADGAFALFSNTTASNNTAVGYQAGYTSTTAIGITAVGYKALRNNTGSRNSAFGGGDDTSYNAALGVNTTGTDNAAFSIGALAGNTTGSYNTASGVAALYLNTTASNNTAVGYQAGYTNTTGANLAAFGNKAGTVSTGNNNTYIGAEAGLAATSGTFNTFVGYGAGYVVTTGGKNTIIGAYSGNQGSLDIRTASNYIVLSDGDGTPRGIFDGSGNLLVGVTSATAGSGTTVSNANNSTWAFRAQSTAATNPNSILAKFTAASPNNAGNDFLYCEDGGSTLRARIYSNGGLANYSANNANLSDRREKTNFAPATSYLDKICAIPVQTFNYIDQNLEEDDGLTLGVVAQDVQAVAPELVMESNWAGKDEEPKMRLSIYQTDLQYALMKCIQEQQAIITALTTRITALEAK